MEEIDPQINSQMSNKIYDSIYIIYLTLELIGSEN